MKHDNDGHKCEQTGRQRKIFRREEMRGRKVLIQSHQMSMRHAVRDEL